MKKSQLPAQASVKGMQSPSPYVPPRTAEGSLAFDRASGMFIAKSTNPPLKSRSTGLDAILLPHARMRWMQPFAAQMTPARIEQILRASFSGSSVAQEQELYGLIESTWPRLMKNMGEVKEAVLGLDWNLMDAEDGEQVPGAKELIERMRDGMKGDPCADGHGWRNTLGALLDARARGISISEIEWEYRGGRKHRKAWLPKQTFDLSPHYFAWHPDSGRLMFRADSAGELQEFPASKFLIAISKSGKGHPSGTALLRCLAWFWCAANFSKEWLLNFAQIFGQPFRWATYDASQEGVRDVLADMMEQMGSAAYGIGPEGSDVKWFESSKSGADNPQSHIMNIADEACDLLILGQTLTSSVGDSGSRALGEVHQSVRADIIDGTALWLAEILNEQLIPAVIAVNMGDLDEDERLPYFQPSRKDKKNIKAIAETIEIVLRSGIPLSQEEVYDALDMAMPAEGDKVFTAPSTPPPLPGAISAEAAPMIRQVLAKLPLDAREYFMARLIDEEI